MAAAEGLCLAAQGGAGIVTNCSRLVEILTTNDGEEKFFDVNAQAISSSVEGNIRLVVRDATGVVPLYFTNKVHAADVTPYCKGRFRGWISREFDSAYCFCEEYSFIAPGTPPEVEEVSAGSLLAGKCDYLRVKLRGVVHDVFRDENDPRYHYLTLLADDELVYCSVRGLRSDDLRTIIGAEVIVAGVVNPYVHTNRRQIGRTLGLHKTGGITIIKPAPSDPFAVPEMGDVRREHPSRFAFLGRRRMTGRVLAVWDSQRLLLCPRDGHVSNVDLSDGPVPTVGDFIEIAGFPETDLFRVNLTRAIWRRAEPFAYDEAAPLDVSPSDIVSQTGGVSKIVADFHGKTIRLRGVVAKIPDEGPTFYLDCEGRLVAVETDTARDALNGIVPGCIVEATGICVMETESWRPNAPFPRMKGFFLVQRSAEDLRVVSRPSWWTARRIGVVAVVLALAVLVVVAWNAALRRRAKVLADRYRAADAARMESELRMRERNALATELHDTIAQNLAGAMFHLRTAGMAARRRGDAETEGKVQVASSSVHSCLSQLRDNLWDLRNGLAAGENLADAVARAVKPHLHGAKFRIEMDVGSERLGEKFAHAVVCALREFTINAVRHGGAKNVSISGVREGDMLSFSVEDDGRGFDVASRPGVDEGHFGLQGVRERIRMFGGDLKIESEIGKGTVVRFSVREPSDSDDSSKGEKS